MNRRTLLAVLSASALLSKSRLAAAQASFAPTTEDGADIAGIEAYLNGVHSLKARFLQVAPNGGASEGQVWLERPGHMRFQYDPPSPFLLVASHGLVVFHDRQLNQTSSISLSETPLGILLGNTVKLSGDVEVIGMERLPGQLSVSVQRRGKAGDGSIRLTFADAPMALRQWSVFDAQRLETRITLYNVQIGGKVDPKLFEFSAPMQFNNGGG